MSLAVSLFVNLNLGAQLDSEGVLDSMNTVRSFAVRDGSFENSA